MSQKIKINCTPQTYAHFYLLLWQGVLSLSPTELEVLTALVKEHQLLSKSLKEPYLSKILFSTESRKAIYSSLGYTPHRFNNYIKYLRDKGIIEGTDGDYTIAKQVIPVPEVVFEFNIQ